MKQGKVPSDRRHVTFAKIMVNLAKSWLTMVKIMAYHDTWNDFQDHGKIMGRSWQNNHGETCELFPIV